MLHELSLTVSLKFIEVSLRNRAERGQNINPMERLGGISAI